MTDIITNEDRHIRQFQRLALSLVPPLERCHRNLCNEVNYVVTTLNLISMQHFDFKLSRQAAILALYDCGYIFFKGAAIGGERLKTATRMNVPCRQICTFI